MSLGWQRGAACHGHQLLYRISVNLPFLQLLGFITEEPEVNMLYLQHRRERRLGLYTYQTSKLVFLSVTCGWGCLKVMPSNVKTGSISNSSIAKLVLVRSWPTRRIDLLGIMTLLSEPKHSYTWNFLTSGFLVSWYCRIDTWVCYGGRVDLLSTKFELIYARPTSSHVVWWKRHYYL